MFAASVVAGMATAGRSVKLPWLPLLLLLAAGAQAESLEHYSAAAIPAGRLTVATASGHGALPLYVSADWTHRLPDVTRALLVVHGALRDADTSLRIAQAALYAAGEAGVVRLLCCLSSWPNPTLPPMQYRTTCCAGAYPAGSMARRRPDPRRSVRSTRLMLSLHGLPTRRPSPTSIVW